MAQKTPTSWRINPAAYANIWTYNQAAITYNQVGLTYNGIVIGEDISNDKTVTLWSRL